MSSSAPLRLSCFCSSPSSSSRTLLLLSLLSAPSSYLLPLLRPLLFPRPSPPPCFLLVVDSDDLFRQFDLIQLVSTVLWFYMIMVSARVHRLYEVRERAALSFPSDHRDNRQWTDVRLDGRLYGSTDPPVWVAATRRRQFGDAGGGGRRKGGAGVRGVAGEMGRWSGASHEWRERWRATIRSRRLTNSVVSVARSARLGVEVCVVSHLGCLFSSVCVIPMTECQLPSMVRVS